MKRAAIVLDETQNSGLLANAAACIATGLFNNEEDVLGPAIECEDVTLIPITKIAILILKKADNNMLDLLERAKKLDLTYMLFTREGQSTTSYEEYIQRVEGKKASDLTIVGLGVIGEEDIVKKFSGNLGLLR